MDDGIKELLKYGATFIALIALFYGGTFVLRHTLGTENPMMVVISQSMIPTLGVGDFIFIEAINDFDHVVAAPAPPMCMADTSSNASSGLSTMLLTSPSSSVSVR